MKELSDWISWAHNNSTTATPDDLLLAMNKISGYTYSIGEELGKKKVELARAELTRKLEVAKRMINHKKDGCTVKESESLAFIDCYELIQFESIMEAELYGVKLRLDQAMTVWESIRSQVSWAKVEFTSTKGMV